MGDYTSLVGLAIFLGIVSVVGVLLALKERREHSAHR
jgi:hypothetical protein